MRTSLIISLVLLALTIAGGMLEETETHTLSKQYESAALELRVMVEKSEWSRAKETVAAYLEDWENTTPWLQILIDHADIDDVSLALERLQAAIDAQDRGSSFEACAVLRENARHIYHRDALTLGNIL